MMAKTTPSLVTLLLTLALLQTTIATIELEEDALEPISFDFDESNEFVVVEEPSNHLQDEQEETYSSMQCVTGSKRLSCTIRLYYRIRDDVWYDKNCSVKFSVLPYQHSSGKEEGEEAGAAKIKEVRLNSISVDDKIVSFTTYVNETSKETVGLQLNRVTISSNSCEIAELNGTIQLNNTDYAVLPLGNGNKESNFEVLLKVGRTFEDRLMRGLMSLNNNTDTRVITYAYEQPREYNLFDAHPTCRPAGYYFVYNSDDEAVVYTADAEGRVGRGKRVFGKDQAMYKYVSTTQGWNDILVCGHVLSRDKKNRSCTLLDENLAIKWRVNEKAESEYEQLVGARVLSDGRAILAHVALDPRVDNGDGVMIRFDGAIKQSSGAVSFKQLFNVTEQRCDKSHVEFGRIYETREQICFSTYCRKKLGEETSIVKRWNVRCMDKKMLRELEKALSNAAGELASIATGLIYAVVAVQAIYFYASKC